MTIICFYEIAKFIAGYQNALVFQFHPMVADAIIYFITVTIIDDASK